MDPMTRAAAWLELYVRLGFHLVFWPRRDDPTDDWKGPREPGWQTKSWHQAPCLDATQVGVMLGVEIAPGRFLLDADFDWAPGIQYASRFLPKTGFGFGRPSKPIGHAFYTTSAPVVSKKFEDVDGTTIVELRGAKADGSVGLQTMLPPSAHRRANETLTLKADGDIAHSDETAPRVALYAVACLLGRHWPTNGPDTNQHDTAAHAAGFLCARGVDHELVPEIVEVAATLGGDDNVKDRVRYARDTVERFKSGERRLTGGPRLAKEIGEAVVARLKEWLPVADSLEAAIDRLNQRFAILSVGCKVVVAEIEQDGSVKTLWPFEEFKKLLIKDRIWVEQDRRRPKSVCVADLWLIHPRGRRYERLVYAMPGSAERCGPHDYNGWLGFTVEPAAGDWSKNRDHMQRIICGGAGALVAWLWNWMAALVQRPGRHAFTAVVLRGGQGVGKGHFAHLMLGQLFHPQQYLHIIGAGMLTGRFNEHLSGKALVFADESTWGGDPAAADKLKGMVTESTIPIERKFLPLVEEPSALHIVIASNNDWPISVGMDDRRFAVFDVDEAERQNDAHFGPLRDELHGGGLAAMLHDLLAHRIDEHALRHPPSTRGKREVMAQSLKGIERWWYEKLLAGSLLLAHVDDELKPGGTDGWPESVSKAALHADYLQFLTQHHDSRGRRSTQTELGMFLKKFTPMRTQRRLPGAGTGGEDARKAEYHWSLPSLAECRAHWGKACGWPDDYDWEE